MLFLTIILTIFMNQGWDLMEICLDWKHTFWYIVHDIVQNDTDKLGTIRYNTILSWFNTVDFDLALFDSYMVLSTCVLQWMK